MTVQLQGMAKVLLSAYHLARVPYACIVIYRHFLLKTGLILLMFLIWCAIIYCGVVVSHDDVVVEAGQQLLISHVVLMFVCTEFDSKS